MGGNARETNRRSGERIVADELRWLGDKARELLAAYKAEKPQQQLGACEQVENRCDTLMSICPSALCPTTGRPCWEAS
jgi:hypothetical protein